MTSPEAPPGPDTGRLTVVSGPPGAGKSAVARRLAQKSTPSVLVAGDAFFGFLDRGAIEPWRPESHRQNDTVIRAAAAAAGTYVKGGYDVVYDGVVGPWFLATFHQATGLALLDYAVLLPGVEVCVGRVHTRRDHEFGDEDATRAMHGDFAGSAIDPRHLITTGAGIDEVVAAVERAARRGDLRYPR